MKRPNRSSLSRREMLKRAAAGAWTAPLFIPASVLGAGQTVAPSERITLGFVGVETLQAEPVARRLLKYWSDSVLRLETTSIRGVRQAVLEKPGDRARACRFRLGEAGLEEVGRAW